MKQPLCLGIGVVLILILQITLFSGVASQGLTPKEDLCAHSFHSFLCNPSKNSKRRLYNGQKSVPLNGENSNLQSTQIRPDEPKLEGDNSNDDPVFEGPGYLPPTGAKPEKNTNLFGDDSFLDPTRLLPSTPKPTTTTTTPRPRPTTPRPTPPPTTTPRPTPRPTTTPRPTPRPTIRTTEPNLIPAPAQNDGKIVKPDDLCAHSFHSFLCDSAKPKKQRRIYNGQKTSPENTNLLGANSFQQPSRLLPTTTVQTPTTTRTTPRPRPSTTYRPTTSTTTRKPVADVNLVPDNTYLSPAYLKPVAKPTTRKPEPDVSPDAAQNPSVRVKADADPDLCKHSFHSFLCDSGKPKKQRRIYNGQKTSPENSNILGENSFQQPSRLLPPTTTTTPAPRPRPPPTTYRTTTTTTPKPRPPPTTYRTTTTTTPKPRPPPTTYRTTTPTTTRKPVPSRNLIPDNTYLSPAYLKPVPKPTTQKPEPDISPDAAQNPSVRIKPDADPDLCKHSFHSFQCGGQKAGGRRRVYNGQNSNILGANSFQDAKRLRPPTEHRPRPTQKSYVAQGSFQSPTNIRPEVLDTSANTYLPPKRARDLRFHFGPVGASSNVEPVHVPAPVTSKRLPGSLGGNPPTTAKPTDAPTTAAKVEEEIETAAAEAPSVVAPAEHHHHDAHAHDHAHAAATDHAHEHDHAHAAATDHAHEHGHDHGHGDHGAHGDHHHHHHNITLEQLCRDPFHAFLCLNVDTSKRRVYDGNPVEDSPSSRERQQLLGSTSVRESRKVAAPSAVKTVDAAPKSVPLSYLQQRSQFPTASTPLTFDVTTYVKEVPTTTTTTTTTQTAPVSTTASQRVVQTKYVNPQVVENRQTTPAVVEHVAEQIENETPRPEQRQRRPVLRDPSPTTDTLPGERVRRPLRRRKRPNPDGENREISFRPAPQSVPEFINRRSDDVQEFQEAPRRVRFGEKVPRRKRLPVQNGDLDQPLSPAGFVRGPRGAVRELAASMEEVDPEMRCQEPFQAYQCGHKVKREAKEDERRTGNMRGQAQGHEAEKGAEEEVKERVTEKVKRVKINKRVEEKVKVEVKVKEDEDKDLETTTEDQYVVYQRGIEEEMKRREEEEENRKEEMKRREVDLKNRKEELKRREKEQERRKVEETKRKEELQKKKIMEAEIKEALKRLANEEKLEDDKEERDDQDEKDEDDKEDAEKDELLSDAEKSIRDEMKRREDEAKRREEELVRREVELKRREAEEKRRLAEVERRKIHDKLIEEELERRKIEKVRVAEELVRRQEEDDRRTAAKLKAEAFAKAQADSE